MQQDQKTKRERERGERKKEIINEEVKMPSFADHLIIFVANHMESTRKLQELISEFSKILRYKVNM